MFSRSLRLVQICESSPGPQRLLCCRSVVVAEGKSSYYRRSFSRHRPHNNTTTTSSVRVQAVIFDKDGTILDMDNLADFWVQGISTNLKQHLKVAVSKTATVGNVTKGQPPNSTFTENHKDINLCAAKKPDPPASSEDFDLEIHQEFCHLVGYDPKAMKAIGSGPLASLPWGSLHSLVGSMLEKHAKMERNVATKTVEQWEKSLHLWKYQKPLKELKPTLEKLKKHGIKVGLCTADSREATERQLEAFDLSLYFDCVVCGDDKDRHPKPHPSTAHYICSKLGSEMTSTIMVGDTPVDMRFGKLAGLKMSVGVLSGTSSHSQLSETADVVLDHIGHLPDLLSLKSE